MHRFNVNVTHEVQPILYLSIYIYITPLCRKIDRIRKKNTLTVTKPLSNTLLYTIIWVARFPLLEYERRATKTPNSPNANEKQAKGPARL